MSSSDRPGTDYSGAGPAGRTQQPASRPDDAAYDRAAMAACMAAIAERQDRQAFATVFDYFAPRLKGFLMRGGAAEAEAEELTQEVMLTVWRKAPSFDPSRASVSTWLYTIARNRRIDAVRREKLAQFDHDDPPLKPEAAVPPDDDVAAAQRETRVRAALEALPQEQAALVRLAFFSGWSHEEIARREELPLGTVKSRIRLAFRKLRAELDGVV